MGVQIDAARVLLACSLELINDEAVDAVERKTGREVRLYLMHAELAGSRENVDILNDETNPISSQVKEALNASAPTNQTIQSVGAHVEIGESDPNWRAKFAGIVNGGANDGESVFHPIDSIQVEAKSPTNTYELLKSRGIHNDVLETCKPELLTNNYFHALLEATKSVSNKIRRKSGLDYDGSKLVNKSFGGDTPVLAVNVLESETDWSDQQGFFFLLQGMFATVRNLTAHTPKNESQISEQGALEFLSFISFLHRRLDKTTKNSDYKRRSSKSLLSG